MGKLWYLSPSDQTDNTGINGYGTEEAQMNALLDAINTGSTKKRGDLWYNAGRYVYVPLAIILCCVALFMHVAL